MSQHGDLLFLAAGSNTSDVLRADGQSYRDGLARLVAEMDLNDHVCFLDRFADIAEIAWLSARTDIYLTPLSLSRTGRFRCAEFVVAAGCPVVSTPYFYAEDLLTSGAGVLVPFGDSDALHGGGRSAPTRTG